MDEVIMKIKKWIAKYPEETAVSDGNSIGKFNTVFLSMFVAFRRVVHIIQVKNPEFEFPDPDFVGVVEL